MSAVRRLYFFEVAQEEAWEEAMKHRRLKGRVTYGTRLIQIGLHSNLNARRYTADEVRKTFWHELTPAIPYEMGHSLGPVLVRQAPPS